jgi:hypothetical protein
MLCNTNISNVVSKHLNVAEADNFLFQGLDQFKKNIKKINSIKSCLTRMTVFISFQPTAGCFPYIIASLQTMELFLPQNVFAEHVYPIYEAVTMWPQYPDCQLCIITSVTSHVIVRNIR